MQVQLWPVIHFLEEAQALNNAAMAAEVGAAGVLLISMQGDDAPLIGVAKRVQVQHPHLKVGVNHLTYLAEHSLKQNLDAGLAATWVDRSGVSSQGGSPEATRMARVLEAHPEHLFFGAVAFKYQAPELRPEIAACHAAALGMVPTTSGLATGVAAERGKLQRMRDALNRQAQCWTMPEIRPATALGLASGVTPENVDAFLGLATHLLVATGISLDEHHFDFEKLVRLAGKVRRHNQGVSGFVA